MSIEHRDLASTQAMLADVLRSATPLVEDDRARALAGTIAAGNERLSPVEQLEIYREQFFLRHLDTLRDDFRSLAHLLGDEPFAQLARTYLEAHPPSSFTLRDLGQAMPQHLMETEPWSQDPLLLDLALVEWAFVDAFDAPEAAPLDLATMQAIPEEAWPNVRLVLAPALQRLALAHRAHDYRLDVRSGGRPERPAPEESYVVVYRGVEVLHVADVDADAYALLDELARGTPLGEACEAAAETSGAPLDTFQAGLGAWFQRWTALGWISRVDLG